MKKAIGLLETRGFTGLAVATDAMLKSASVELHKQVAIGGGFVTTVITGDVGSVKAAVEAGTDVTHLDGDRSGDAVQRQVAKQLTFAIAAFAV